MRVCVCVSTSHDSTIQTRPGLHKNLAPRPDISLTAAKRGWLDLFKKIPRMGKIAPGVFNIMGAGIDTEKEKKKTKNNPLAQWKREIIHESQHVIVSREALSLFPGHSKLVKILSLHTRSRQSQSEFFNGLRRG